MNNHEPNWPPIYDQAKAHAITIANEYWDSVDPEDPYELPDDDDTEAQLGAMAANGRRAKLEQIQGPRIAPIEMKMEAFRQQQGCCFYCAMQLNVDNFHADHATPYSRGGHTVQQNIVAACKPCNIVKNTYTAQEYQQLLQTQGLQWRDQRYTSIVNNPDPF